MVVANVYTGLYPAADLLFYAPAERGWLPVLVQLQQLKKSSQAV